MSLGISCFGALFGEAVNGICSLPLLGDSQVLTMFAFFIMGRDLEVTASVFRDRRRSGTTWRLFSLPKKLEAVLKRV